MIPPVCRWRRGWGYLSPERWRAPTSADRPQPASGRPRRRHAVSRRGQSRSRPIPTCAPAGSPASARSALSTRATAGLSVIAGGSRSLAWLCRNVNESLMARRNGGGFRAFALHAARGMQGREHVPGGKRDARIDQHRRELRYLQRLRQHLADAAHQPRARIEADRHVGAGAPRRLEQPRIVRLQPVGAREQPQRRGGVRRAAADPRRDRQALGQRETAEREARHLLGQRARGLEHEIVVGRSRGRGGRAAHRQRQRAAGHQGQTIAETVAAVREHDEAREPVIAVGAAAEHGERQIDLGRRGFGELDARRPAARRKSYPPLPGFFGLASAAEVSSGDIPDVSFCSIFASSSGSGLRSLACDHWNLASITRPTFQ